MPRFRNFGEGMSGEMLDELETLRAKERPLGLDNENDGEESMPDPETKSTWDEERKRIKARRALEISRGVNVSPDDGAVVAAGIEAEEDGEEG